MGAYAACRLEHQGEEKLESPFCVKTAVDAYIEGSIYISKVGKIMSSLLPMHLSRIVNMHVVKKPENEKSLKVTVCDMQVLG